MSEVTIKALFEALAKAAVGRMSDAGDDLGKYGPQIALYDARVDQHFISLEEFPLAEQALCGLGIFRDRFGENACKRVALQFVYEILSRIDQPVFEARIFEDYWSSFWEEIENPDWTYFVVTNLNNFQGDFSDVDMGDGITIRGRSFDHLRNLLGWGDFELESMTRDWMAGGGSSYVLIAEHTVGCQHKWDRLLLERIG